MFSRFKWMKKITLDKFPLMLKDPPTFKSQRTLITEVCHLFRSIMLYNIFVCLSFPWRFVFLSFPKITVIFSNQLLYNVCLSFPYRLLRCYNFCLSFFSRKQHWSFQINFVIFFILHSTLLIFVFLSLTYVRHYWSYNYCLSFFPFKEHCCYQTVCLSFLPVTELVNF